MEGVLLWSLYAVCIGIRSKIKRKNKRLRWSREWLLKRHEYSHVRLLRELHNEADDWRNYLRMDAETYKHFLNSVIPYIMKQNTCMRKAISAHERLSATLRFLATGRSYKDLEFTTIMSKQSLSAIIPETCDAIYRVLKKDYLKFPESEQEWLEIAAEFERKWQFPHCLGSIDGKHIRIIPPKGSGSYYFNYKKTQCIVLMAICNANCEFIYCDAGTNGRISDGGVIANTRFYEKLVNNDLKIPKPEYMLISNEIVGYTFVGDEAFAMRPDLIKPYNREALNREQRIFNYRLSRARRTIENTFGILASRFRIFHTAINLQIETIDKIVLTCCVLHNFLRKKCPQNYTPAESMDRENIVDYSVDSGDRCDPHLMYDLQRGTRGQILNNAKMVREKFSVPWQDNLVFG